MRIPPRPLNKIPFLFMFLFLWAPFYLTALDFQKSLTQYKLDIWRSERGFEQNGIHAVLQSADGYVWVGALDGLVRFDGSRFNVYTKENTGELKSNFVRVLCRGRDGSLWIGTSGGGLTRFKHGVFSTYVSANGTPIGSVYALSEDRDGGLWIGTHTHGVIRFREGKFTGFTAADGLAGDHVDALYHDREGNLWIGTSAGLTQRTPEGKFINYGREDGFRCRYIYSLCGAEDGALWIGSNKGLYRLKGRTPTHYGVEKGLPNPQVMCLYRDRDGSLWGGTDGGGLFRVKGETIETLSPGDGPACGFVYSICEDREGSLWFGTLEGGLHRLRDTVVTAYTTREGLAHDYVNCIREDRDGNLRIGVDGGLNRLKNGVLTLEFSTRNGLLDNDVYSFFEDGGGALWIGTGNGLHRFRDGKLTPFTTRNGSSHNRVYDIFEDKQGGIKLVTSHSLQRFHKGKFTVITRRKDLFDKIVAAAYQDPDGTLWLGSGGGGLFRWRDGRFTVYTTGDGLVGDNIECIFRDRDGILNIGARGGLSRMINGRFVNITAKQGLADDFVNDILEDDSGHLWLAGRKGVSRISKKELRAFERGAADRVHPVTYNEQDGMKSRWCKNNGLRSRDGRLWFSTDKGVAMIDPANIKTNRHPPPVLIEALKLDDQWIDLTGLRDSEKNPLVIPPGKRRLEFRYTGLSFVKPRKVRFQTRLDGYDTDWLDAGNARGTTYTGLPPGRYTLKITAGNSDGVWNHAGASFTFYVKPFFYQTTWFYIAGILAVVLVIFSGFRLRVRQLKERERRLCALVDRRTETLNQRTQELEKAHAGLHESKQIIEEKNRNILASIEYARKIQQAVLPPDQRIAEGLKDYFIVYQPRDIVSGDFYWINRVGETVFIAVVDCTGHGVPGAFLSMIGSMELNELVSKHPVTDPAHLLFSMDEGIRRTLREETNAGGNGAGMAMETGMCMIQPEQGRITFAGAKRPLYYVQSGEFSEIKGDRKTIGVYRKRRPGTLTSFTNHDIPITGDTIIYLTSDGFADQSNPKNKKYGARRLKEFLHSIAHLPMKEQEKALLKELDNHRSGEEQRDDITIIGIKIRDKG